MRGQRHWFVITAPCALTVLMVPACGSRSDFAEMLSESERPDGGSTSEDVGTDLEATLCGNGIVDENEACDDLDLNGETCASATMMARPTGQLGCTASCTLDLASCGAAPTDEPSTGGAAGAGGTSGVPTTGPLGGGGTTGGFFGGTQPGFFGGAIPGGGGTTGGFFGGAIPGGGGTTGGFFGGTGTGGTTTAPFGGFFGGTTGGTTGGGGTIGLFGGAPPGG